MARERIVLETSGARKAALVEQLDLQGESLSAWLEDQIESALPTVAIDGETGPETLECLLDPIDVFSRLSALDWAFTDADTRFLTHDLHPYPAKFPPQIPAQLIQTLSLPGDVVFDPFGGSATTAVEAVRLRRRAVSLDANPLSELMGHVKTAVLSAGDLETLNQLQSAVESYIANGSNKGANWSEGLIAKFAAYIPAIPNIEKWFAATATGELALLRHLISNLTGGVGFDVASLALSRIVNRVSNQESETRYVSEPKLVPACLTLRAYLESLRAVTRRLEASRPALHPSAAKFFQADARTEITRYVPPLSVDLIVTSPPYPNATDYHLYHRFRLFWLGHDPRQFGGIEIGSHLKHQRLGTGFEEYCEDMAGALAGCFSVLQPSRYAVFVVGDAVFKQEQFSTSKALCKAGLRAGFEVVGTFDRPIHDTKRSFAKPGRRARSEQIVVLRRPNQPSLISLAPPSYRMWEYEKTFRSQELAGLGIPGVGPSAAAGELHLELAQPALWNLRRATFSTAYGGPDSRDAQPTWQRVLENGDAGSGSRKDPKYATHGLHPYKGKFYPQLAKSLLNASGAKLGSVLLDPYCGSGTVPLEGLLNGYRAYGVDMNPLAAKIARAKSGILLCDRSVVAGESASLLAAIDASGPAPTSLDQFPPDTHEELQSWFPLRVLNKINWLLKHIRLFGDPLVTDYFEVILSSIIRDSSHQEPSDLRIRRRKDLFLDAPVYELFSERVKSQLVRLQKYWAIESRQPGQRFAPSITEGDSRSRTTFSSLGLGPGSVDCVVTSPPYATALPYIDTDRLSILAIMGQTSGARASVEESLTGSREIKRRSRLALEAAIEDSSARDTLPDPVVTAIRNVLHRNQAGDVGFRRENMAALLWRYFKDVRSTLEEMSYLLRSGGQAYVVLGDSRTNAGGEWTAIETCRHTSEIAASLGFKILPPIEIAVTRERLLNMKNAITENQVLVFRRA